MSDPVSSSAPAAPSTASASPSPTTKSAPVSSSPATTNIPGDITKSAAQTPVEKEAAKARLKFKLKVDGAEKEMDFSEEEVSVRLQKGMAAEKRMQEAAELRKKFEAFQSGVKQDPFSVLKEQFGVDALEMAKQRFIEEYEAKQLQAQDPKQYEVTKLQRELEQFKQREQEWKQAQESKAQAEHEAKLQAQIEDEFMTALDSSDLPKTKQTLSLMAQVALEAHRGGVELTTQQLVSEVNDRLRGVSGHVFKGLKGEQLAKFLGDDVVREVLRHSVNKVRPAQAVAPPVAAEPVEDEKEQVQAKKTRQLLTWKQFMRDK